MHCTGAVDTEAGKSAQFSVPGVDVAQRAAHRVILLPAHQLVDRHHDGAAPAGVGGVDAARLRVGALVLEDDPVLFLSESQHHPVDLAVSRAAALDIGPVAPNPVGQQR
jgi:hypothetical protein